MSAGDPLERRVTPKLCAVIAPLVSKVAMISKASPFSDGTYPDKSNQQSDAATRATITQCTFRISSAKLLSTVGSNHAHELRCCTAVATLTTTRWFANADRTKRLRLYACPKRLKGARRRSLYNRTAGHSHISHERVSGLPVWHHSVSNSLAYPCHHHATMIW